MGSSPDDLLAAWPLPGPWTVVPAAHGTNNHTWLVTTPADAYLLRLYLNTVDPARVRYEHALLRGLRPAGLTFAVPAPVPTRAGDTLVVLERAGETALAALFPLIPGRHPEQGNLAHARAAGAALAELDRAFAGLVVGAPAPPLATYGDLAHVHPLVPDPLALPHQLPLAADGQALLSRWLDEAAAVIPALYQSLPRQFIHGDLARGNVLLDGDRVSGILDFEFAAPDLRAMDLAVGLVHFAGGLWDSGRELAVMVAFGRSYLRICPLAPAEIAALPVLLRLQRLTGLVHWTGRRRQGLVDEATVVRRVDAMMALDRWLTSHGTGLVAALGDSAGVS